MTPRAESQVRWPRPRVVAHRGGGRLAPENTLAAIRLGARMGFRGVEFDVMLAGCGTPVLIHDETLKRTSNGRGEVARTPYAELARLDAGAWFSRSYRGEPIPAYEDAVRVCRELGLWANVEIKPSTGYDRRTGEAVALASRARWAGAPQPPVLSSFSTVALAAARSVAPELPRGLLVGRIPPHWHELMRDLDCVALHCNHRALNARLAARIHDAGYGILTWTVNERRTARKLLGWGVDCLVTDALGTIGPSFR
ncbi:MAG: glycerophosphodiester phosphodiesterase [Betaproteobacteria bacterium RIFCSPLOWO2_02_FULL_66_14]|nr:MAG: glycerophosphodiester phosphodiesterase [Betaproteobacteria bacterium RIFCSPLOWO2_02_FULL_66_14]